MQYIYIEPYCFLTVSTIDSEAVVYNTITKSALLIVEQECVELCRDMAIKTYPYILLQEELIDNDNINSFISKLKNGFYGDVVESEQSYFPIISPNIYNQINCNTYLKKRKKYAKKQTRELLDVCKHLCFHFDKESNWQRDFYALNKFWNLLPQLRNLRIVELNICNLDLSNDSFDYLFDTNLLKTNSNIRFILICRVQQLNDIVEECTRHLDLSLTLIIRLSGIKDISFFRSLLSYKTKEKISELEFIVNNKHEIEAYSKFEQEVDLPCNYTLEVNNSNSDFMYNVSSFKREQLLDLAIDESEIIEKAICNPNFWGKVSINSQLDCHIGQDTIVGNLNIQSFDEIIFEAIFRKGSQWMLTRNSMDRCSDCAYRLLCPPISTTELSLDNTCLCDYN